MLSGLALASEIMESYRQGDFTLFFAVEALDWRLVWAF